MKENVRSCVNCSRAATKCVTAAHRTAREQSRLKIEMKSWNSSRVCAHETTDHHFLRGSGSVCGFIDIRANRYVVCQSKRGIRSRPFPGSDRWLRNARPFGTMERDSILRPGQRVFSRE